MNLENSVKVHYTTAYDDFRFLAVGALLLCYYNGFSGRLTSDTIYLGTGRLTNFLKSNSLRRYL